MSIIDADSGAVVPDNATQPFPDPGETALDHVGQAAGRVLRQYQNSPKLQALIAGLAALGQRLENCLVSINACRALATDNPTSTVNVNLDVTGELVGQSRVLSDGTVMENGLFLQAILLRIARNMSKGSMSELIAALTTIFGGPPFNTAPLPFRCMSFGGLSVGIELGTGASPSSAIIALIDPDTGLAPWAMGVSIGREWYDTTDYFAFAEDTGAGAKGFGIESDSSVGGQFAMLF